MKTYNLNQARELLGNANKTYILDSIIDLEGGTLNLQAGCTIIFRGGYFTNSSETAAKLYLNGTKLYPLYNNLQDSRASGTINIYGNSAAGTQWYNATRKAMLTYDGSKWLSYDGCPYNILRSGTTAQRPNISDIYIGFSYFDTTLSKPIWCSGNAWVDATGAAV